MAEDIRVNGTSLSRLVSNVESLAGLLRTPQRRSQLVAVPGAHGALSRPNPVFDAGRLVLPMWVMGVDPSTGQVLDGDAGVTQFYATAAELAGLFHQVPLHIEHELPDGTVWECWAEMVDEPLDFTREQTSPLFGRFTVFLSIPAAFWRDQAETASGPHSETTGGPPIQLAEFAGGSAPIDDMIITFGQGNNPQLMQESSGLFVAYDGVIAPGRKLVLDVGAWQVNQTAGHPGIAGSTVWSADLRAVRYHPDVTRWWQLEPEPGGPRVTWTHTGGGEAAFAVQGHRKSLIG